MAGRPEPPPSTTDKYPTNFPLDDIVTLEIGEKSDVIRVHKGILIFYSGYFRAALDGNFAEATKGVIKLPTEESKVVKLAVTWMYIRKLNVDSKSTARGATGVLLCKLWAFADRREVPMLANHTIDHLRCHLLTHWYRPSNEMVRFTYANTTTASALQRFLVLFMALSSDVENFKDEDQPYLPQEAIWDLMKAVWTIKDHETSREYPDLATKGSPTKKQLIRQLDMCELHVHESGVICKLAAYKRSRSDPEELPAGKASKKK
ncbi:hypothetical protein KC345_g628 [Hortaea werneckii]|nr:hypothetical protein KC345_g628 [Hortaea werneckii]